MDNLCPRAIWEKVVPSGGNDRAGNVLAPGYTKKDIRYTPFEMRAVIHCINKLLSTYLCKFYYLQIMVAKYFVLILLELSSIN